MVNFELVYCLVNILIGIMMQNEFLHFVIQILYSKSLPDSTNSRKMSSRSQHYLISSSFWDVVLGQLVVAVMAHKPLWNLDLQTF